MTAMKLSMWHAAPAVLGISLLSLTGCEVSQTYGATCTTSPPVPHQEFGTITATADVPPRVHPGDTFTVTIEGIGVEAGPSTSPPPARSASISIAGAAEPSGSIGFGSIFTPATWPATVELTATGQPGDKITLTVVGAQQLYGSIPEGYLLSCTADGYLATIDIVEP